METAVQKNRHWKILEIRGIASVAIAWGNTSIMRPQEAGQVHPLRAKY